VIRIQEVIVVEGRDDVTAVKQAVDAEVIITGGFGFKPDLFKRLREAQKRKGIIVLTDPDQAGNWIRRQIAEQVPGARHAFIEKKNALDAVGDVGVEYASPEVIRAALEAARVQLDNEADRFDESDLVSADLSGGSDSARRRLWLGEWLGIGFCNGKQFLHRLNRLGVTREEWIEALERLEQEETNGATDETIGN